MVRPLVVAGALMVVVATAAAADDEDVLRRGERERTSPSQIEYHRAIRHVLSRAWRGDVVLRMVSIPAFDRELAVGLTRSSNGYTAFATVVAPPDSIWYTLGFGASKPKPNRSAYRRLKPIVVEKPIPERTAARVAALWRRVLANPRNYRGDGARFIHLHSTVFTYYLSFAPGERITAWMPGWRRQTLELIDVAQALSAYAEGLYTEGDLIMAIAKAERKIGI